MTGKDSTNQLERLVKSIDDIQYYTTMTKETMAGRKAIMDMDVGPDFQSEVCSLLGVIFCCPILPCHFFL